MSWFKFINISPDFKNNQGKFFSLVIIVLMESFPPLHHLVILWAS